MREKEGRGKKRHNSEMHWSKAKNRPRVKQQQEGLASVGDRHELLVNKWQQQTRGPRGSRLRCMGTAD